MQGNETDLNIDIANYVDLVLLAEIIDCKISFLKTTPPQLLGYGDSTESEIAKLEETMHILQREKSVIHLKRWNSGLNTMDLDLHLTASMKTGSQWGLDKVNMDGKDFLSGSPSTLSKEKELHLPPLLDANRQDHIKMWLFDILKVSEESWHLHRKFLSPTMVMDDAQWERQVLKYWLLDEATTGLAHETESTNGAVNSAGECKSTRVMIEESKMADIGEQEKVRGRKRTRDESVAGLQRSNGADAGSTTVFPFD